MKRKVPASEKPLTYLLTLETQGDKAEKLADVIRSAWSLEPVEIQRAGDSRVWLEVYFPAHEQALLAQKALERRKEVRASTVIPYAPRDWQRFYKKHVRRRAIGKRLEICPVWEARTAPMPGRIRLLINPGMSFGTGDHFTTRFCLEAMERYLRPTACRSMLDVGAGSGILAIAARKLGCPRAKAVDVDPDCLGQIRENAEANRITKGIDIARADALVDDLGGPYDLVCANLYYELLLRCVSQLLEATRDLLILSGVREQEADAVSDILTALGAREILRDGDGEWAGLAVRKAPARRGHRG